MHRAVRSLTRSLALTLALALPAGGFAQTLVVASGAQPDTLDPQATSATSAFQIAKSIYDTLVEVAQDGTLQPLLADDWTVSEDGLTWTFTLNEATFHDGTAFDADDVVASLNRIADPDVSPKADEFEAVDGVVAVDARTVRLELSRPAPALLASLASGWGAMLPSEKLEAGHDFGTDPVGTGAFRLDTWVRDGYVRLEANPDYFAGAPAIDGAEIRFVEDAAVQAQGLLAGDFHVIADPATADLPTLEGNPDVELVQEPSGTVLVTSINTRRPYLEDARVRRALNLAVDAETVLEVAYGGGTPTGTFMEPGSPWLPADVEPYGYDPERARALLDEAGVPDDLTLDMALPQPYEVHVQAGQIVQDMLGDVGIDVEIRVVEWGVWLGEVYGGPRDFDLTVIGHTGKLDPTGRLGGYGDPDATYTGWDDADAIDLLAEAAQVSDRETRGTLYADVLTRMHENPPFVYFGASNRSYAQRADVNGFWITPLLDSFDLRSVTLD